MSTTRFSPSGPLRGSLRPPPDKSISHRAALIAAMGEGSSRISGYLDSADTRSTLGALAALGASVESAASSVRPGGIDVDVGGIGLRGPGKLAESAVSIDVGNAGTLMRLLPGWLAGQGRGEFRLDGDESIRRRPVDRIADPLRLMGAGLDCRDLRLPPLTVIGSQLSGIEYKLPVASAQVKSCLLLAGLLAGGETTVIEPSPSRDHSERMLSAAGAGIRTDVEGSGLSVRGGLPGNRITIGPAERIELGAFEVPGDISSAAFHLVAALIVPGSRVRVEGVGINPTRVGLLGILTRMGARIEVEETGHVAGEPVGAISARSGPLHGTRVAPGEVPLAIDELPLVALAACFADGETVVEGAAELRHKESDRITAIATGLGGLGGAVEQHDDGFTVRGSGGLRGGSLDPRGDHRFSMLAAIAGLASAEGVEVEMAAAGVSYPGFERDLRALTP